MRGNESLAGCHERGLKKSSCVEHALLVVGSLGCGLVSVSEVWEVGGVNKTVKLYYLSSLSIFLFLSGANLRGLKIYI